MAAPSSAQKLPQQTPNTSSPIAEINQEVEGLLDSSGKPITGTLSLVARVTSSWRYLFGTFVQRSASVNPTFSLTADVGYSQAQIQALSDQVAALSAADREDQHMTEKTNAPLALTRVLATGAKVLHELLLDPDIGPMALLGHTKTDGIDLVPFLADERNIALLAYDSEVRGAILFAWMEPGVYEVHTMCKRDARGAKYVRAVRDAIRIMFTMSDAIELYTRVPRENRAALGLVRLVYGKKQFVRADGTPMYALRFWDWLWSPSVFRLPNAESGFTID